MHTHPHTSVVHRVQLEDCLLQQKLELDTYRFLQPTWAYRNYKNICNKWTKWKQKASWVSPSVMNIQQKKKVSSVSGGDGGTSTQHFVFTRGWLFPIPPPLPPHTATIVISYKCREIMNGCVSERARHTICVHECVWVSEYMSRIPPYLAWDHHCCIVT